MFRLLFALLVVASLGGCAELASDLGLGPSYDRETSDKIQALFDKRKAQLENQARAGQITWVQAMQSLRDADKKVAAVPEAKGSWKFDSDDEEYYAYCIALAERLDNHQITYAQFDAARTQRFSQIEARRNSLNSQRRAATAAPSTTSCTTRSIGTPDSPAYKTNCW